VLKYRITTVGGTEDLTFEDFLLTAVVKTMQKLPFLLKLV
jgi:hypothetical protein